MRPVTSAVVKQVFGLHDTQARLVAVLTANVGNVVPTETLCDAFRLKPSSVRAYIFRAKRRLIALGLDVDVITQVHGVGYRASGELCRWVRILATGLEQKAAA